MARFADAIKLMEHFRDHFAEFEFGSEAEYLAGAIHFLVAAKPPHVYECTRKRGDRVRFDPRTDEFVVLAGDGVTIRTYFKPIPCKNAPPQILAEEKCHTKIPTWTTTIGSVGDDSGTVSGLQISPE
jgi:hypothetical protein